MERHAHYRKKNNMLHNNMHDMNAFSFPVEMQELTHKINGETHPTNYKAIVRTDSNHLLHVAGDKYKLVSHDKVFGVYNDLIAKSGLKLDNIEINDEVFDNGRKASRVITFKDHEVNVNGSDSLALQLQLKNSLDSTWVAWSVFGAIRFLCMNGCVFGDWSFQSKRKHTGGFNPLAESRKIGNALDGFNTNFEQVQKWANTMVSWEDVKKIYSETIAKSNRSTTQRLIKDKSYGSDFSESVVDVLMRQCERDATSKKPSLWNVYNGATYWSTHAGQEGAGTIRATAGLHNVQHTRQQKVSAMLNSDVWLLYTNGLKTVN